LLTKSFFAGGLFATHLAALFFRGATPDTGVLVCFESELQALHVNGTLATDRLGLRNLQKRLTSGADREEQFWVGVAACCLMTPGVVGTSKS
jgi:hypothetical protein